MLESLKANKEALEALESFCTIIAIIAGGFWALAHFYRRRERFPRARFEQDVVSWEISEQHRVVRVKLTIHNHGEVLLPVSNGFTWIQQVKPWPPELLAAIAAGKSPLVDEETEVRWPLMDERKFAFSGQKELEPGESDELNLDFVIDKSAEEILIYSHVDNDKKLGRNMGWSVTSVHSFTAPQTVQEDVMSEKQRPYSAPDKRQDQAKPRPEPVRPTRQKEMIQGQPKERPESVPKKP